MQSGGHSEEPRRDLLLIADDLRTDRLSSVEEGAVGEGVAGADVDNLV